MPKRILKRQQSTTPENLKPYEFHGLDVSHWNGKSKDVTTDCPFCGREEKFNIVVSSGVSRCVVCNVGSKKGGMNASSFVKNLWYLLRDSTDRSEASEFALTRKVSFETAWEWGLVWSHLTGHWMLPAYNAEGTLTQLYSYRPTDKGMTLFPTPTLGAQLFGVGCYNKKADTTYLVEGPWDGIALWDSLCKAGQAKSGKLLEVSDQSLSLASSSGVLAVPGAGTFNPAWSALFGENVVVMYDNDHERTHESGQTIPPAGINGVKRVVYSLTGAKDQPKKISYLRWGERGWDESLPHGCDVRDILTGTVTTG